MVNSSSEPTVELQDLLPQIRSAQVDIQVHVSVTLNITPFVARQKVGGLVLSEVGTGIGADEPTLVVSNKRVVWRVPKCSWLCLVWAAWGRWVTWTLRLAKCWLIGRPSTG